MNLLTDEQRSKLLENGRKSAVSLEGEDHFPVVKLYMPNAPGVWLLSELDPSCPDRAFGLCDLGHGDPELGFVDLSELSGLSLVVKRDESFTAEHRLSFYTKAARIHGLIVT